MNDYSQAGQSTWVHGIIGDSGYFVDVGAHDGIVHSNTYALEQLGWTGLCIEPDPGPFEELVENRDCLFSNVAVGDHHGEVPFLPSGLIGICRTLTELLEGADAPPTIQYMSIDVEGHELQVLAGMDFDRWHVRLITIEHNLYCDGPERKDAIYDVLTGHGFERVKEDVVAPGYGPFEDFYEHRTSRHDPRPGSPA